MMVTVKQLLQHGRVELLMVWTQDGGLISLLLLSYEHFASCLLGNARKWKEKGVILFYLIIIGSLGEKLKEVYINLIKVIFYKVKL